MELESDGEIDPWVKKNISPFLRNEKLSKEKAVKEIIKFVGKERPYLISFVIPFDYVYLTKLFGFKELQKVFQWPPIDFASILFGYNIDPERYYLKNKQNFFKEIGIDAGKYKLHNALDDAKLLRYVYFKLFGV